ncbi:MAG: hypothetical protein AB7G37_16715 [Solirubrobacteraceae bacterium]
MVTTEEREALEERLRSSLEEYAPPAELPPLPPLSPVARLYASPRVHRVVPRALDLGLVRARVARAWRKGGPERDNALKAMELLLGKSERASEVPELAKRHLVESAYRSALLWRPWDTGGLQMQDAHLAREAMAAGRGVILTFLHHGPYVGLTVSVDRAGVHPYAPIAPFYFEEPVPGFRGHRDRQHAACLARGATTFNVAGGLRLMLDIVRSGRCLGIAPDLPGNLEVTVLGRRVRTAPGAAKLSQRSGALVVPVVMERHRGGARARARMLPAIDPTDHESAESLQQAIFDAHAPALLAWPEALEWPLERWVPADPADAERFGFTKPE